MGLYNNPNTDIGGKKWYCANSLPFSINEIKWEFDYAELQLHIMFSSITFANLLIPLVIRYVHFHTSCCPLKSSTIKMLDGKLFFWLLRCVSILAFNQLQNHNTGLIGTLVCVCRGGHTPKLMCCHSPGSRDVLSGVCY